MKLPLYILLLLLPLQSMAWQLRGVVLDDQKLPVAYASVYVENSTYGVATNIKGEFVMNLENGTYSLVFQAVGYEK
ncbi:MAG: carboxypeptidase-like regulatory domain-containing protein, partial [Salibacteraceae bacterium]|nr:carboxypeptidase-like regulatory domain-containing protein [Salibacteraceae bacterium]